MLSSEEKQTNLIKSRSQGLIRNQSSGSIKHRFETNNFNQQKPTSTGLANYTSQLQFKELTKNIKRLDGKSGKYHTQTSTDLDQSFLQNMKNESLVSQRKYLLNEQNPNPLGKPFEKASRQLKKSASGKYFSFVDTQIISDSKNKQVKLQQNQAKIQPKQIPKVQKQQPIISLKDEKTITQSSKVEKQIQMKKFKPLRFLVLLHIIMNVMFAIPAIYMFFTLQSEYKKNLATTQYCFLTVFYISSSFYIVWGYGRQGYIELFMMHFLLDPIFVIFIIVSIGFVGMLTVSFSDHWFNYVNLIGVPIMHFFFVGNFRLFLKWVILQSWQVILWKLSFFIDGLIYFGIGAYYMAVNYKLTGGFMPEIEGQLKDFCLLFVFANFSLFMELFGAVSGKDKTQDLQYKYIIDSDQETENFTVKSQVGQCQHCTHCQARNKAKIKQGRQIQLQEKKNHSSIVKQNIKKVDLMLKDQLFDIPQESPIAKETIKQSQKSDQRKIAQS